MKAAVDNGDTEAISEHKEALELVSGQSDYAAVRAAANRGLHFILVPRSAPVECAPVPDPPMLSFVSGAAALLDAVARNMAAPPEPEATLTAAGAD